MAKYALFAGVEQLALWVCEHGAENLARYCAEGDAAIYASYLKTLDFVVDFAVKHGVCGALNKKLATANGYSARQFNLNKPHEFKDGGSTLRTVNPRIINTPQMQKAFVERMIMREKIWRDNGNRIGGKKAYYDPQKNLYYTEDRRHYDIEVWQVRGKWAYHKGSIECERGIIYKEPKHPRESFL